MIAKVIATMPLVVEAEVIIENDDSFLIDMTTVTIREQPVKGMVGVLGQSPEEAERLAAKIPKDQGQEIINTVLLAGVELCAAVGQQKMEKAGIRPQHLPPTPVGEA